MKKLKILQIAVLCFAIIGVCLTSFGCANDNEQIRSVITKFYKTRPSLSYVERYNSHLVTPDYDSDLRSYGLLVTVAADYAKKVEILFSEIDVQEDFATAKYSVHLTKQDGEELSAGYITQLVKYDGKWKLSFTRAVY